MVIFEGAVQTGTGTCGFLDGPVAVGAGTMTFAVDDTPIDIAVDTMGIAVIPDSLAADVACNFAAANPVINEMIVGSGGGSVTVDTGSYDLFDACYNTTAGCSFKLTWSAPY